MFQYQMITIKAKHVNANILFFQQARRIADKAVAVDDMDETVNRDVPTTNQEANQEACKQSFNLHPRNLYLP